MSIRSAVFALAGVSACLGGIGISPRAMADDDQPLTLTIEATEQDAPEQTDDADAPAADAVEADAVVTTPDHVSRENDLKTWLPGLHPGDKVSSHLNPVLWPAAS